MPIQVIIHARFRSEFLENYEKVLLRILGAFYLYEEADFDSCNRKLYCDVLISNNSVSFFCRLRKSGGFFNAHEKR